MSGWKGIGTSSINSTIEQMKRLNLNTILIDVKNAHGELFYEPLQDRAKNLQVKTGAGHVRKLNIDHLVNQAQKNDIRLVARHVMFRDEGLYMQEPQWQLHK